MNSICRNASLSLYQIGKIRNLLNNHTTEILVHSFVTSLLDSYNCLLINLPNKDIAKLQRIQNSAARLVSKLPRQEHITPTLQELHWLPVSQRIQYKVIILTFKALHQLCPSYISELVTPYIPTRSLRSASQHLIEPTKDRTKSYRSRRFSSAASHLWNSLPTTFRTITDLTFFQSQLKTYLFKKRFLMSFKLFY